MSVIGTVKFDDITEIAARAASMPSTLKTSTQLFVRVHAFDTIYFKRP